MIAAAAAAAPEGRGEWADRSEQPKEGHPAEETTKKGPRNSATQREDQTHRMMRPKYAGIRMGYCRPSSSTSSPTDSTVTDLAPPPLESCSSTVASRGATIPAWKNGTQTG